MEFRCQKERRKNLEKRIISGLSCLCMLPVISPYSKAVSVFSDVPESAWYYSAVSHAKGKGIISGYPDGTFKPEKDITRVESIKMISSYQNDQYPGFVSDTGFADVSGDAWYAVYVEARGEELGGTQNGLFFPDDACTREDFAVGLYHALKLEATNWEYAFKDSGSVTAIKEYRNAVLAMGANGIMV